MLGVRTDDKGVDKNGEQKSNFEPGYDLKAKVVILAEGSRGSLTKQLIGRFQLDRERNPQTYGVGVKELWELPAGRIAAGEVIYTMGYPLTFNEYGGAWIYGSKDNLVSLGFVTGLDYRRSAPRSRSTSCRNSRSIPSSPNCSRAARWSATAPSRCPTAAGGAFRRVAGDGWMILGDSAGFLNSQRLKGIHLAIKSGMLAAETAFDAMAKDDFSLDVLEKFQDRVEKSWIKTELWPVRNFHQGFDKGFLSGMLHAGIQQVTGGRGLRAHYSNHAGHLRMKQLTQLPADGGAEAHIIGAAKGDGKLTFDKLTDVYYSGTKHEEDQPAHLVIHDTDICNERCVREFGNPCKNFCPANVYEMVEAAGHAERPADSPERLQLRALQDLRHHGSLRDHHLGAPGGRRRPELRGDVKTAATRFSPFAIR